MCPLAVGGYEVRDQLRNVEGTVIGLADRRAEAHHPTGRICEGRVDGRPSLSLTVQVESEEPVAFDFRESSDQPPVVNAAQISVMDMYCRVPERFEGQPELRGYVLVEQEPYYATALSNARARLMTFGSSR